MVYNPHNKSMYLKSLWSSFYLIDSDPTSMGYHKSLKMVWDGGDVFQSPESIAYNPLNRCMYAASYRDVERIGLDSEMVLNGEDVFTYPKRIAYYSYPGSHVETYSERNKNKARKVILVADSKRRPHFLAYNSSNHCMYVAVYDKNDANGDLIVIDVDPDSLHYHTITNRMSFRDENRPIFMAHNPHNQRMYVIHANTRTITLLGEDKFSPTQEHCL